MLNVLMVLLVIFLGVFIINFTFSNVDLEEPIVARDAFAIVGGFAGLLLLGWRNRLLDKNEKNERERIKIQNQQRLDGQFIKSAEMLAEGNTLSERLAAVANLKALALRSSEHRQQCVDLLCAQN